MNKPLNFGGASGSLARVYVLALFCLTCVGLGSVSAQSANNASASLRTSQAPDLEQRQPAAPINWRPTETATLRLKTEIARLESVVSTNQEIETQVSITRQYYTTVLDLIGQSDNVGSSYANSYQYLVAVGDRFSEDFRPDYAVVRRNLLTILTQ